MKYEVFWKNPGYKPRPELKKDIECDYLIVGGGITGVALAYFLASSGAKNIVLIEKNTIGSGATGKSAGTLALKGELDLNDIIAYYGEKKGLIYWNGNHKGLQMIKDLIKKENIDCDFEPLHTLFCGYKYKTYENVFEEYALEKKIESSSLLTGNPLKKEINTALFTHALLSYDAGISINPLKFTQNLSKVVEKKELKFMKTQILLI